MAMAVNCVSSSSLLTAKPSEKPFSSSLKKSPFLGFSLAASSKPSVQSNRVFKICCQDKTALIPAGQNWMFDDLDGPVRNPPTYLVLHLDGCLFLSVLLSNVCLAISVFCTYFAVLWDNAGTFCVI